MRFKFIIGLDIGTNSLGWCILKEYDDGRIEIIKTGVHIFPIGTIVDEKSNKEKTKNEQRRQYRGASRMRYRFKLRRENLLSILEQLGMAPDYSKYHKTKGKGQSYELYKLRANAINPDIRIPLDEIGRIFMLLNKYRGFKSNRKNQKEDKETGEIKKGIAKLKEYMQRNNAKTIGHYFFLMHDKAKRLYEENKWHNYNEPIDERAYINDNEFILFNSNGIRRHYGRPTSRELYLDEFDQIWAAQKKHYPEIFTGSKAEYDVILSLPYRQRISALKEFQKTNYWHIREYCIYYQRPLKSQKKFVSTCQFERGKFEIEKYAIVEDGIEKEKEKKIWTKKAKKACPKSHPLFQEFRIWQKLHQINYSSVSEDVYKQSLKREWLPIIADFLMYNKEIYLGEPSKNKEDKQWIGKLLQEKKLITQSSHYSFFIDKSDEDIIGDDKKENKIAGNITYAIFKESLREETFNRIREGRFEMKSRSGKEDKFSSLVDLWHHLYIAKDGLFKEVEWLKCILMDEEKWNLTQEEVSKLIEKSLPPDYASYSSKVLKAILPFMRKGMNEYDALKAIDSGYVNEDNTIGAKIQLKDKISQLKYQELRNPVVERALSKTIKLVNAILDKYRNEIDKENFEIRIESTRQFKKPRQERENERRLNAEKDRLRDQYAQYLTKNKEKLGFKKDINKYDSLVVKYELWLQMNMNEDDEMFIKEFKAFAKITKEEDKLKHALWLECGRRCPYTGDIINFTDCFSAEVEIEHIIPLSRSLDDSFNNKTLTWRTTNTEKGSMTPLEYLSKKGEAALKIFKTQIKGKHNNFSDSKRKLFLTEKLDNNFLNQQLSNSSYIAKYARKKMQEVCKDVQFTNGSATAQLRNYDWGLATLLDKIRYEESFGINMDDTENESGIYSNYYRIRNDFTVWYKKRYNTTDFKINWNKLTENEELKLYIHETNNNLLYWNDEVQKFNEFRNKFGKKDRSDHRHHAIDAFIIAACSPKIIKQLSIYNAAREQYNIRDRNKVEINFDYNELRGSISNILVSYKDNQTLIKKRKNRIKTKNGIKEDYTYAPQGKLHEESFYAKRNGVTVRRVELFDDQRQEKALFEDISDLDYSVKGVVRWHYIDDQQLYEITKNRLNNLKKKAFTKEEMEKIPFYRVSPQTPLIFTSKKGKTLPVVKSIRKRFNIDRTLITLSAKDNQGNLVNENRFANNDSNALMVLYEERKKNKKPNRAFEILSFYKVVSRKNPKNKSSYIDGKLFYDEKENIGLNTDCEWISVGETVFLYIDEEERANFDWSNLKTLKERLFVVKGLTSDVRTIKNVDYEYGYASLLKVRIARATSYPTVKDISESIESNSSKVSHVKLNAIKVRINILGDIVAKGNECF